MRWRPSTIRSPGALAGAAALTLLGGAAPTWAAVPAGHHQGHSSTATPIKHVVVLHDENVSFDHYFATYPKAANTDGTKFTASKKTPRNIDTLAHAGLLTKNPNQYAPKRLTPSQARVMDYYDGNTVTGLWNYAQQYSLNGRSFSSVYGPSTPGALNLISGQTHGVISVDPSTGTENPEQTSTPDAYTVKSPDAKGVGTVINDPDPAYDDCAGKDHTSTNALAAMQGKNIGDLLNAEKVSWGWFQGGFRPSTAWNGDSGSYAKCDTTHTNIGGASVVDYSPHHNPFAYYKSTANPHHLPPKSVNEIGHNGQANHNYDLTDFDAALKAGKLPRAGAQHGGLVCRSHGRCARRTARPSPGHQGDGDQDHEEQRAVVNRDPAERSVLRLHRCRWGGSLARAPSFAPAEETAPGARTGRRGGGCGGR